MVKKDEAAMKDACEKMGIPHPKLFVMMLLMQSYDKFMGDQMKQSEKMMEDAGNTVNTLKESSSPSWGSWGNEELKDVTEEERKTKHKEIGKQWMDMFKVNALCLRGTSHYIPLNQMSVITFTTP